MRISSFFENFNTKHDKLGGLTDIINEIATRFQELGTKVSFSPQNRVPAFHEVIFRVGAMPGRKPYLPSPNVARRAKERNM